MKKEEKKKEEQQRTGTLGAVVLGLSVNKEPGFQEDFWEAQKIGHTSCLVDCTGYALG